MQGNYCWKKSSYSSLGILNIYWLDWLGCSQNTTVEVSHKIKCPRLRNMYHASRTLNGRWWSSFITVQFLVNKTSCLSWADFTRTTWSCSVSGEQTFDAWEWRSIGKYPVKTSGNKHSMTWLRSAERSRQPVCERRRWWLERLGAGGNMLNIEDDDGGHIPSAWILGVPLKEKARGSHGVGIGSSQWRIHGIVVVPSSSFQLRHQILVTLSSSRHSRHTFVIKPLSSRCRSYIVVIISESCSDFPHAVFAIMPSSLHWRHSSFIPSSSLRRHITVVMPQWRTRVTAKWVDPGCIVRRI